jgi:light-regulated signal transduction histidine kinase (bacteriophytochrome)
MAYQFHPDEHGEVIAEVKSPPFSKYLGLHYPASDIPRQARELFLSNWVRMIPSSKYTPASIIAKSGLVGSAVDLGRAFLRSVSPVHLEYLSNMGVNASLTISLIQDGKLWGLITGHHYSEPKHIPYEVRVACETLGRLTSSQLGFKSYLETRFIRNLFLKWRRSPILSMD